MSTLILMHIKYECITSEYVFKSHLSRKPLAHLESQHQELYLHFITYHGQ